VPRRQTLSHTAYLGAGARDGDRAENLSRAVARLEDRGMRVLRASSIWETGPVDLPGERTVFNAALEIATSLGPRGLLEACLEIERALGRRRAGDPGGSPDPGPRPIDLDLLIYDAVILDEPGLVLPHPRMCTRAFVLAPLAEIAPDLIHPERGLTIAELLARCDTSGVRLRSPLKRH